MSELILVNPNGSVDAATKMRAEVIRVQHEALERINAATDAITEDNYSKEKLNAFDGEKKFFEEKTKAFVQAIAEATHAQEVLVQLAAAKNEIASAIKARQEKIRELKAAHDEPTEKFEYILEIYVDQETYKSIVKKMEKDGIELRARRVKDGESAKIAKLFN